MVYNRTLEYFRNGEDQVMAINRAVFLDRDGVITEDPPHYAHRLDQLSIIPGSAPAIRLLNEHNFRIIVISNQSGVARGYYGEADVKIFNDGMESLLAKEGAHIDRISYCPHHPDAVVERYKMECSCRKPRPGMILDAARKYSLDLKTSFVVGDKWSDIEAGQAAGCKTILVMTGHGKGEIEQKQGSADFIARDLQNAVEQYILPAETNGKDK
jgi:D-glycero-D-manno-heptose 1,7-bisphosphate phosphatase